MPTGEDNSYNQNNAWRPRNWKLWQPGESEIAKLVEEPVYKQSDTEGFPAGRNTKKSHLSNNLRAGQDKSNPEKGENDSDMRICIHGKPHEQEVEITINTTQKSGMWSRKQCLHEQNIFSKLPLIIQYLIV